MAVGIVGKGHLGTALGNVLENTHDVEYYDIKDETASLQSCCKNKEAVFVCVNLEHNDLAGMREILRDIRYFHDGLIFVNTTLQPGIMEQCGGVRVVYNPLLIAKNSIEEDLTRPSIGVLGGHQFDVHDAEYWLNQNLYRNQPKIARCSYTEAEMMKLHANTLKTLDIVATNQLQMSCAALGISANRILSYLPQAARAGMGESGPCRPRDNDCLFELFGDDTLYRCIDEMKHIYAKSMAEYIQFISKDNTLVVVNPTSFTDLLMSYMDIPDSQDSQKTYILGSPDAKYTYETGSIIFDPWGRSQPVLGCKTVFFGN